MVQMVLGRVAEVAGDEEVAYGATQIGGVPCGGDDQEVDASEDHGGYVPAVEHGVAAVVAAVEAGTVATATAEAVD